MSASSALSIILSTEEALKKALTDIRQLKEILQIPQASTNLEIDFDDMNKDPTPEELNLWKVGGLTLSPTGEAVLYAFADAGKSRTEIAKRMGIHENSVSRVLRRR